MSTIKNSSADLSDKGKPGNIENKIREIENRIKRLYNKQDADSTELIEDPSGKENMITTGDMRNSEIAEEKSEKSLVFDAPSASETIFNNDKSAVKRKSESLLKSLDEFDQRFENLAVNIKESDSERDFSAEPENALLNKGNNESENTDLQNEINLPQQLFDSFYQEKTENASEIHDESIVKDKLEMIDDQINQIKDGLSSIDTEDSTSEQDAPKSSPYVLPQETTDESEDEIIHRIHEDEEISEKRLNQKHGPIMLRPKAKKAGLFNDVNLTEDYELGFRFYQLGFKTGFFNVKLDDHDESSRIATAEFFPNKFWSSVKQRSRWVAGIVFQNWAAHKWKGNLATKYFLFRDRKSFFSFFGAFLSNILLVYLTVSLVLKALGYYNMYSLVGHSSVLWYLMIANLLFMVSRLSHRFIFTYNWYGLDYAFFSLFRLPLDTVVNFFAIARSMSVYRNTISQKKVVWDSTSHY
jgi:hypothetical protein